MPPKRRSAPKPAIAKRSKPVPRVISRKATLDAALRALGLQRRSDSRLCDEFVAGACERTAEEVAEVMAEMKYYHEYCQEFIDEIEKAEEEVEEEVERTAEENRRRGCGFQSKDYDDRGFYRGINAECMKAVLGTCSWAEYKDGLMARFPLPSTWPWL
jgi:hypothetical protein